MKLSAWRDDVDINYAALLLDRNGTEDLDEAWSQIEEFIVPGLELKARYALEDLWQNRSRDG